MSGVFCNCPASSKLPKSGFSPGFSLHVATGKSVRHRSFLIWSLYQASGPFKRMWPSYCEIVRPVRSQRHLPVHLVGQEREISGERNRMSEPVCYRLTWRWHLIVICLNSYFFNFQSWKRPASQLLRFLHYAGSWLLNFELRGVSPFCSAPIVELEKLAAGALPNRPEDGCALWNYSTQNTGMPKLKT